jgi:hypothetical protein
MERRREHVGWKTVTIVLSLMLRSGTSQALDAAGTESEPVAPRSEELHAYMIWGCLTGMG